MAGLPKLRGAFTGEVSIARCLPPEHRLVWLHINLRGVIERITGKLRKVTDRTRPLA
jgi:hypothetical protein